MSGSRNVLASTSAPTIISAPSVADAVADGHGNSSAETSSTAAMPPVTTATFPRTSAVAAVIAPPCELALAIRPSLHVAHRLQLLAKLLGDRTGIDAVAHHLRPDEDDDLGALLGTGGAAEQVAEELDVANARKPGLDALIALADEAAKQHH